MKILFLTRTRLQRHHWLYGSQCLQFACLRTWTTPYTISEASTMITACLVVDDLRKDYYHYGIRKLSPTSAGLPVSQTHARILFIPTCTRLTDNASLVGTAPECSYDYPNTTTILYDTIHHTRNLRSKTGKNQGVHAHRHRQAIFLSTTTNACTPSFLPVAPHSTTTCYPHSGLAKMKAYMRPSSQPRLSSRLQRQVLVCTHFRQPLNEHSYPYTLFFNGQPH